MKTTKERNSAGRVWSILPSRTLTVSALVVRVLRSMESPVSVSMMISLNWIKEQFGEIPQGVDYSKHILEVLSDIQAESGVYFQSRQNLNRDTR